MVHVGIKPKMAGNFAAGAGIETLGIKVVMARDDYPGMGIMGINVTLAGTRGI
jgi:hypothetical protein